MPMISFLFSAFGIFGIMSEQQPTKIVVELVSSEAVRRLEARDDDLRDEMKRLESRMNALHRTLYELLETLAQQRRT